MPELLRTEGFSGLYKGFLPGLLRDVPGTGAYFWCFAYLKELFDLHEFSNEKQRRWKQYLLLMLSGGVSG